MSARDGTIGAAPKSNARSIDELPQFQEQPLGWLGRLKQRWLGPSLCPHCHSGNYNATWGIIGEAVWGIAAPYFAYIYGCSRCRARWQGAKHSLLD